MQPGRFGGSAQFPRVAGKHWPLISLRVAEEELHDLRTAGSRRGDRIGLVDVSSDAQHGFERSAPPQERGPASR